MSAPITRYVLGTSPEITNVRNIENHYHMEMVAENTRQIAQIEAASLHVQMAAAAQAHQDMQAIGWQMDEMNDALAGVQDQLYEVGMGISDLNETAKGIQHSLQTWFAVIAEQLMSQQKTMTDISETLCRPLETTVKEIRRHADHALKSGMASEGEDRQEWYRDATDLLQKVVENPVGKQDYVAWFQIGWLLWKHGADFPKAEEAFHRAARLSTPARDLWLGESLRHVAYMQYLQGNYDGALQSIKAAVEAHGDAVTLYDGARYMALKARTSDAASLLEKSLRSHPPLVLSALAEADFADMRRELRSLIRKLTEEARAKALKALDEWDKLLAALEECETITATPNLFHDILSNSQPVEQELRDRAGEADYLTALSILDRAQKTRADNTTSAQQRLHDKRGQILGSIAGVDSNLKSAADARDKVTAEAKAHEASANPSFQEIQDRGGCALAICAEVIAWIVGAPLHWGPRILVWIAFPIVAYYLIPWIIMETKLAANASTRARVVQQADDVYAARAAELATDRGALQAQLQRTDNAISHLPSA